MIATRPPPSCGALAGSFMRITLSGFGGVLPFAKRELVDAQRWLDEREFTDVLSASQLLPGANVVNVAVMVGHRFHGARGVLAAIGGLLVPPFLLFLLLGAMYQSFSDWAWVQRVFAAVAAATAGLVLSVGISLARAMPRRTWAWLLAMAAFVAVVVFRLPLVWVVLALGPLGVAAAWRWPA